MRRLKGSKAAWGLAARFVKPPVLWEERGGESKGKLEQGG